MTIWVYLDTQDYSVLSENLETGSPLIGIKARLENFARNRTVQFLYSSVLVSEIAPVERGTPSDAAKRASLMEILCGRTTFISLSSIFKIEFESIGFGRVSRSALVSRNGDWFPSLENIVTPVDIVNKIKDELKKEIPIGNNRRQRRKLKKSFNNDHKLSKIASMALSHLGSEEIICEMCKLYPMKENNCRIIVDFFLGRASKEEAEASFLDSLRDPSWMMQWFDSHRNEMNFVSDYLRRPSRSMIDAISLLAAQTKELFEYEEMAGIPKSQSLLNFQKWIQHQDALVERIGNSTAKTILGNDFPDSSTESFDDSCPGFSTAIRAMHSSAWNSIGCQPRKAKPSDIADALHAVHAPYVDIFRSDKYMSPQIAKLTNRFGTIIVPSLADLPDAIEAKLAAGGSMAEDES